MGDTRFIYTTWPNAESAANAAREIVGLRHAACANILPGALSFFWWEGEVQGEPEIIVIFKTSLPRMKELRDAIEERHPYDTPSIVALDIDELRSNREFIEWIKKETR